MKDCFIQNNVTALQLFTFYFNHNDWSQRNNVVSVCQIGISACVMLGHLGENATGPKKLGVFGASYLYPVFVRLGVIKKGEE